MYKRQILHRVRGPPGLGGLTPEGHNTPELGRGQPSGRVQTQVQAGLPLRVPETGPWKKGVGAVYWVAAMRLMSQRKSFKIQMAKSTRDQCRAPVQEVRGAEVEGAGPAWPPFYS